MISKKIAFKNSKLENNLKTKKIQQNNMQLV